MMFQNKRLGTGLTVFSVCGLMCFAMGVQDAHAGTVFVGSTSNTGATVFEVGRWSRTNGTVPKTYDIDGDDYYGTDGYTWMNNAPNNGSIQPVFANLVESAPSYLSGIAYTGAGIGMSGASGAFNAAQQRLSATDTGPTENVGYAGVNYATGDAAVQTLQEVFAYTMSSDMGSETLRMGVVLDSLSAAQIGADDLRIVAGGDTADATLVGASRNGVMDMYFFDIKDLSQGDEIQIWLRNATVSNGGFNAATIGGVTFDTLAAPTPEPSTFLLATLGLLGLGLTRRRRRR